MHAHTRIRPRATAWRLGVAAWVVVAATTVGPSIAAAQQSSTNPNPQPLWRAFPLDDDKKAQDGAGQGTSGQPTGTTQAPSTPPGAGTGASTRLPSDEAGDGPPWLLILAAGAGGALFVALLIAMRDRRAPKHDRGAGPAATDEWPWLTAEASSSAAGAPELRVRRAPSEPVAFPTMPTNGTAPPAADRAGQPQPAFDVREAVAVPRRRFERDADSAASPHARAAASRRGPICQVRWSARSRCFYAVTTDAEGIEHRLAWSPRLQWYDAWPPEEDSREAQAALRVLSKELRDKGWRPMRVKGSDFDAQRWYARRFRFPTAEGEDERAPGVSSLRSGSARA